LEDPKRVYFTVAGAKFYPDDPNNPVGLNNASQLLQEVFKG